FFTGSVPTGKRIAQAAAEKLIPVTLELGGKDAAIVLADANIPRAAMGVVWSAMFNAGQTCGSVERVLVDRRSADGFVSAMQTVIGQQVLNAGGSRRRELGAVTKPAQIEIIDSQVRDALAQGGRAVIGGYRLNHGSGRYYAPT